MAGQQPDGAGKAALQGFTENERTTLASRHDETWGTVACVTRFMQPNHAPPSPSRTG